MKITLRSTAHDGTTVEISSSSAVTLTEVLDLVRSFLLGSGYHIDGNLVIEDEPEQHEEDPEYILKFDNEPPLDINDKSTLNDDPAGLTYKGGSSL